MAPSADTLLNRFIVRAKFRQMQVLVKLAELGSMHRAAEAVNMTQPAISNLVSEMEKMLETELFFRHARGVEPTDATKELLPIAQRILDTLAVGAETVANRLEEQGGVVRVLASPAALGGMIAGRLDSFAEKYPDIQVQIGQLGDNDPLSAVAEETADIICTREPRVVPEGWSFETCLEDKLIAVCGHNHRLAKSLKVSTEALGNCRWLLNRVDSVARKRFEEIAERCQWPQSSRCQIIMHIPEMTKQMLLTGEYLAILPMSVAIPWFESGEVKALKTEIDTQLLPLGFLWQPDRAGTATTKFATFLQSGA